MERFTLQYQLAIDSNLDGTLAVGQGRARFGCGRIAACHLFGHLLGDGRLALEQTGPHRLFSGRGGVGASPAVRRPVRNTLSTTCCGVRIQGARVKTVATVAIRFLLAFCPLVGRGVVCAAGLDHGYALAIDRRHQDRTDGRIVVIG